MIRKFLELTLPMKLLWSSIAVVIVGPGFSALVGEFASYWYAIKIGIRPPLEGIPYLATTLTAASVFIPVMALAVFLLMRLIVNSVVAVAPRFFPVADGSIGRGRLFFRSLIGSAIISVLALCFLPVGSSLLSISIVHVAIALLLIVVVVWESLRWFVPLISIIVLYPFLTVLAFSTSPYAEFLRYVGYGGGAKVVVEHETASGDSREENYYLLLRTSEALVALKQDKVTVIEIPIESVSSIQYALGSQSTDYVDVAKLELKSKENGDDNVPVAPVSSAVESGV